MALFSKQHTCEFKIEIPSADGYARFFINRICKVCGKTEHKDLRYGSEHGWRPGPYTPASYHELRRLVRNIAGPRRYKG